MKAPSYLWLSRHNIYYFRVRIPVEYRPKLGRNEYRVSLNTRCPQTARREALQLWLKYDQIITTTDTMKQSLTKDNLDQLILTVFEYCLNEYRCEVVDEELLQNPEFIETCKTQHADLEKQLAHNTNQWLPDDAFHTSTAFSVYDIDTRLTDVFTQKQFKARVDSIQLFFSKLSLLRIEGKFLETEDAIDKEYEKYKIRLNNTSTVTTENLEQLIIGLADKQANMAPIIPDDLKVAPVSVVIEAFLSHLKMIGGKKAPGSTTLEDYGAKLKLYQELLNDREFHTITKAHILELRNLSYNIPVNVNKINYKKTHANLTALIKDKNHKYEKLAVTSASRYTAALKRLCLFAFQDNYCTANPAEQVKFSYTKVPQIDRDIFSNDDLSKIFNGHVYQPEKLDGIQHHPYHFWLPLLGAFTGARLNELCSLTVNDIKYDEESKCWYFDINNDDPRKKVKTKDSIRLIPVHLKLIDMGFLQYVEQQKNARKKMLFSSGLTYKVKSGWGDKASTWFNRLEDLGNGKHAKGYLAKCDVKKPGDTTQKVYHSFRHTFIHNLKNNPDVSIDRVADLCGHEKDMLQTQSYGGSQYLMPVKVVTIAKLNYDVDLSHINYDQFKKKLSR